MCYGDINCTVSSTKQWIIHAEKATIPVSWDIGHLLAQLLKMGDADAYDLLKPSDKKNWDIKDKRILQNYFNAFNLQCTFVGPDLGKENMERIKDEYPTLIY